MEMTVKAEKIPWVPVIILTLIFSFLGPVIVSMSPNFAWYSFGAIACFSYIMVMPVLLIMGAAIVGKIMGKSINTVTYTCLYAVGTMLTSFTTTWQFPVYNPGFMSILYDRVGLNPSTDPWPSIIAPSGDVIKPMVMGGAAVPWGAWIPTFVWWWMLYVSFAITWLGWGIVWRRRWIDSEKVPFPQTRASILLVEKSQSTEKSFKARMGMPFLVGLVLGIVFMLPLLLANLFPWFPDIFGWRTNTCPMGAQYITSDSPLTAIIGLAKFNKDPALGAVLYMAPLNVLFGGWFFYLIFLILMQVAYTMGYYSELATMAGCGRVWCGTNGYNVGIPFKWNAFTSAGVTTGIFISYIALNWRYLAETFNASMGKLSKDKLDEFEKIEPTSYRNAYIMIVGSIIVIIALFMVGDVSIPTTLMLIITNLVVAFVVTRTYSLVGTLNPAGNWFYFGPMKMLLNNGVGGANTEWYMAMSFTQNLSSQPIFGSGGYSFSFLSSLSSYQVASANNVSTKIVFKVLLFVCILAPLVSLIGTIWGFYTFGITRLPNANGVWGSYYSALSPSGLATRPTADPWWPNMLAGIIVAVLLGVAHAKFIWFPLDPFGLLLATDGHALGEGIWSMCLVAWVAKTITLRVGGSKLYERTGIPTAIGFIIGFIIVNIIGALLFSIRFFYPF